MKKIITLTTLFIIALNLFSQNGEQPIYSMVDNKICTNNAYISNSMSMISNLEFTTNKICDLKAGKTLYDIKVGRFNGWENEPGNFDVIEFYKNGTKVLTFKNQDGIVRLDNPRNLYTSNLKHNSSNNYFIERDLTPNAKAIIFLGQHYGTDLPNLIIFIATPNDVKLVYCEKMHINSIDSNPDSFSMLLQSNINEEGDPAITHTIREKDGILWFKNN